MFLFNQHDDYGKPLDQVDAETFNSEAAAGVERHMSYRTDHAQTPLHSLPSMAYELDLGAVYVKDEGHRLGLGSFKALGGSYAVMRLVQEQASRQLGRPVDICDLNSSEVRSIAARMTVACATAGNHGRSVAKGAQLVGAKSASFVHDGVSDGRVAAIARFGARIIRVAGTYDDCVDEASRVAAAQGWTVVSDTSWPGYERIPGLVMQGYTSLVREALRQLPAPPTHVFLQAGVGGLAAAVAGHLALVLGDRRPTVVIVEPTRAACLLETARAGHLVRIDPAGATVMAMLECHEPSLIAWRVLSRIADAFMTVEEEDAVAIMRRLARPPGSDPAIVAGESGGAGLAGLLRAAADDGIRNRIKLDSVSRVLVINTEGATDPARYLDVVGVEPAAVLARAASRAVEAQR